MRPGGAALRPGASRFAAGFRKYYFGQTIFDFPNGEYLPLVNSCRQDNGICFDADDFLTYRVAVLPCFIAFHLCQPDRQVFSLRCGTAQHFEELRPVSAVGSFE